MKRWYTDDMGYRYKESRPGFYLRYTRDGELVGFQVTEPPNYISPSELELNLLWIYLNEDWLQQLAEEGNLHAQFIWKVYTERPPFSEILSIELFERVQKILGEWEPKYSKDDTPKRRQLRPEESRR